jgi:hypothetical protein
VHWLMDGEALELSKDSGARVEEFTLVSICTGIFELGPQQIC